MPQPIADSIFNKCSQPDIKVKRCCSWERFWRLEVEERRKFHKFLERIILLKVLIGASQPFERFVTSDFVWLIDYE